MEVHHDAADPQRHLSLSVSEDMSRPKPKPGVMKITPYAQGESELDGVDSPIKLSSNESSFGPSPKALAAYRDAATTLHRYPDGSQRALRQAIADAYGLEVERIVCGNGSDELIQLVTRAFVGDGDEVLMSENGFVMCRIHALAQGADVVVAPESGQRIDIDALIERLTERTRLITLANPNNPTGTYLPSSEIRRLHQAIPDDVILLLDGAYAEYVVAADYDAGAELVEQHDNVVMTRTFSKIYGLSSLRIGWAYVPLPMMDALQRIRTPFNANGPAMAAAQAAVGDQEHVAMVRSHNARWQAIIRQRLSAVGIDVIPSVTNFYLMTFPVEAMAAQAAAALNQHGIIPRPVGGAQDTELRITVGSAAENEAVLAALEAFMQAGRATGT